MNEPGFTTGPGDDTARFAREVTATLDQVERLQRGVDLVATLVPAADHAGVSMITRHGVVTDAASSDLVWRGDQLQYDLAEGPCLDTVRDHGTVVSNDVANDPRWPRWSSAVTEQLGVRAMLSVLLYADGDAFGALNMYAETPNAFSADDLAIAETLAAHLSVALADSREIEQRGTAMRSRTVIGQAEGILMERYKITADGAFEVLRRLSQNSNRKLVSLAVELTSTGQLAGLRPDGRAVSDSPHEQDQSPLGTS